MELTPRKKKILAATVELYIVSGEPVGSKVLCENLDIRVSSATVRNEMSDWAVWGFKSAAYVRRARPERARLARLSGFPDDARARFGAGAAVYRLAAFAERL